MTEQQHPITPPPELRRLWAQEAQRISPYDPVEWMQYVSEKASQWGADQKLEACCEVLENDLSCFVSDDLRAALRPKPPRLKEQALKELAWVDKNLKANFFGHCDAIHTIRRALEALPDD